MERLKISYLIIGCLCLLSCASPNTQSVTESTSISYGEEIDGELTLYANLNKSEDGTYSIKNFSTRLGDIRLNDLKPTFPTETKSCSTNLGWKDSGVAEYGCDAEHSFFRKNSQTGSDLTSNVALSYLTALGAIVTAGGVVIANYSTVFDIDEYNDFIKQELSYEFRKEIFDTVKKALVDYNENFSFYKELLQNKISEITVTPRIFDNTGLFSKEEFQFTTKQVIAANDKLSFTWVDNEDLNNQYQLEVSNLGSKFLIKTYCKYNSKFNVSTEGCDQVVDLNGDLEIIEPIININYLYEGQLKLTPNYANDEIEVLTLENDKVRIINKTSDFIIVDSISLYVNEEVRNISGLNMELAPESFLKQPFSFFNFNGYNSLKTLANIDKDKLHQSVTYGLAIKYKRIDEDKSKTLYEKTTVKVGAILSI